MAGAKDRYLEYWADIEELDQNIRNGREDLPAVQQFKLFEKNHYSYAKKKTLKMNDAKAMLFGENPEENSIIEGRYKALKRKFPTPT
ncbi:hypothetical protein ABW20_dc0101742 [Dactylellina cionopaga]|nr:hypothetical protein ABW20_dc0101742 [Dactylellina cionopaga]